MSAATRLVLVRHAEPEAAAAGVLHGIPGPELSERGVRQARALAEGLRRIPFEAVYSSPARRALDTAAALARLRGLTPRAEAALREIDAGSFEGLNYAEIERADPHLFGELVTRPTQTRFPGGEDYRAVRERALAVLGAVRARHDGATALLVAHAGPLRAMLADCLGMPDDAVFRLDLAFASVSLVEWADTVPVVRVLNGDPAALARALGLEQPAAPLDGPARPRPGPRLERPPLPAGFDDSRARERRRRPDGWRFADGDRAAVWRAISERRDIRRFRPDRLDEHALRRLLEAAHRAPSVGMMQPWRFVVVRDEATKAAMQALAARERLVQAEHLDERARHYLDLKIEGVREAPIGVCVCCDRQAGGPEVLGRHTIRDTDLYSTCLAIENLWLVARAEGIGVGWVSFYRPDDVARLLGLPPHVVPVAWLCIGYPDERPTRPGLEAAGWQARRSLDAFVHEGRWRQEAASGAPVRRSGASVTTPSAVVPRWWRRLADAVSPGDVAASLRVRDDSDELVKPVGSLGALELAVERFAMATGAPPPPALRPGIVVFASDHGIAEHAVSLYPSHVGAQVAAAAARGETAIGVLASAVGGELVVVDVGLRGPRIAGLLDRRVADGSADITRGPALTPAQLRAAVEAGHAVAFDLARRSDLVVVGEIGIGNTTVAATLLAALTGLAPEQVCGRGTGVDSQGLAQKQAAVSAALGRNDPDRADPLDCLRRVGGLEIAALVGAQLGAAAAGRPVLLDGLATGVAALVACRLEPSLRDYLIAGHRSAEPAHALVLTELGLEPLLDLRMRLGEASGAALALPLIALAGRLHADMSRFADAGVEQVPAAGRGGRPRSER